MTSQSRRNRRVPFHAHPIVTAALPSILGLVVAAACAAALDYVGPAVREGVAAVDSDSPVWLLRIVDRPWQALLLGVAVGIPAGVVETYALLSRFPLFVRRTTEGISPSAVDPIAALAWIPSIVAPIFAFWLGWTLSYAPLVACFAALIPVAMTYPEERRIFKAIQRALQPPESPSAE